MRHATTPTRFVRVKYDAIIEFDKNTSLPPELQFVCSVLAGGLDGMGLTAKNNPIEGAPVATHIHNGHYEVGLVEDPCLKKKNKSNTSTGGASTKKKASSARTRPSTKPSKKHAKP